MLDHSKKFIVISFLFLSLSLKAKGQDNKAAEFTEVAPDLFSLRQNLTLGLKEKQARLSQLHLYTHQSKVKSLDEKRSPFFDIDQDGVPDIYDPDIDGDGIHNHLDSHPFDSTYGQIDSDRDGIPDFVDFDSTKLSRFAHLASEQERIKETYGVSVIADLNRSSSEVESLFQLMNTPIIQKIMQNLNSLSVVRFSDSQKMRRAEYHADYQAISLFGMELKNKVSEIKTSFSHELFHVVQNDYPELYREFIKLSSWERSPQGDYYWPKKEIAPSLYSKQGPDEHFAESGLASLIDFTDNNDFSMERFHNLELYLGGSLDFLFQNFFLKLEETSFR